MLPNEIREFISSCKLNEDTKISVLDCNLLSGGCINEAAVLKTNEGDFFIKWNNKDKYPLMLEKEAISLEILAKFNVINVPDVILYDTTEYYQFLLLRYISSSKKIDNFWLDFAEKLANLHKQSSPKFGFEFDNFIGSLYQSNKELETWPKFFTEERLLPMIKLARNSQKISSSLIKRFERFFYKIDEIFPKEQPALIHGDLWNGNFMIDENGEACLIDPAIYFGFREMDIAMSKLFGGFDYTFYGAYNDFYPMEKGWEERVDYCNLYPLLVHVNLFGGSYINSVERILSKF